MTRCRSKGRVDSGPSELINSADASPPPFLSAPSARPGSNRRIRDKSSRPPSPTSACRAFPLVKIATNREKACPSERGDRDNSVGVLNDTREDSREMILKRGAQAVVDKEN